MYVCMYVEQLRVEKALEEEKSRVSNYLNTESCAHFRIVLVEELLLYKESVGPTILTKLCHR